MCACGEVDCKIAFGLCHCGCGEVTTLSTRSNQRIGLVRGEPRKFIVGHNQAKIPPINDGLCICGDSECAIELGKCHCGCGNATPIAKRGNRRLRSKVGFPLVYCMGHFPIQPRPPLEELVLDGKLATRIPLTKGAFSLIDSEDLPKITGLWCATKGNGKTYAMQNIVHPDGKRGAIKMHRAILGCDDDVDHKNGDSLDNRKRNLRPATDSQNGMNQMPQVGRSSRFKGVSFAKRIGMWESYIKVSGKKKHLGNFLLEENAAKRYDEAAREHFGEFAWCNFPKEEVEDYEPNAEIGAPTQCVI